MSEPASIRSKNPGAMWGHLGRRTSEDRFTNTDNPIAVKWGSTQTEYLSDGLGQGNNIAHFPTMVQGACAQFDLWCERYAGMNLAAAIKRWSGGNWDQPYADFLKSKTGLTLTSLITPKLLASPSGLALMKAQAAWESGRIKDGYPMTDAEWQAAQNLVFHEAMRPPPAPAPAPKPQQPVPAPTQRSILSIIIGTLAAIFKGK